MSVNLPERMARLEEKVDGITGKVNDLQETLSKFIESADERYAPKWVADGAKWLIGIIIGAVVIAVLALILKQ